MHLSHRDIQSKYAEANAMFPISHTKTPRPNDAHTVMQGAVILWLLCALFSFTLQFIQA